MSSKFSRLDFLRFSALGASTLFIPRALTAAEAPKKAKKGDVNDKINIGFIGLGQQAIHLVNGFLTIPEVRVIAGCDIYDIKRNRFIERVNKYYSEKGIKNKLDMYIKYEELLAREDIDAVVIATPDHWHAAIAIAACKAGKDVYLEKPLTFTVYEGQRLIEAVRANNRILQVGSMQRSMAEFIHAANVVREGKLGKISTIYAYAGEGPLPYTLETTAAPAGLDWERWVGPLPAEWLNKYNHTLNPLLNEKGKDECWGAWRWYQGLGGGFTTDWGAHMFDIAQWCLGKDGSAPTEILPPETSPYEELTYRYDNGVEMIHKNVGHGQSVKIYGENGWIMVKRGQFLASSPEFMPKDVDQKAVYETNVPHYQSFINSIRSRRDPSVPVEVGHSSCVVCTIGNIAYELKRTLEWNPIVQKFMGDEEANSKLHYEYREPYKLE
ncbi:MAG: Gfo/Idh/MocA family oxidoreductase [Alistipes sp.]|nr:Gfo/Idh/MocA family oxidoreductase [Rikenellaceae bacterium]MBO5043496.1 Gfo/Idh/MocA family oxidoreductase [Alistipes sp.]MBO5276784.1 Gfo/Idh/MocA family oxidoreductase [Alistipes sp.]MBO5331512.1 Gfo/Idh/MocA family oxidoreductase [Alistipes sp.]MBP3602009.1 Gfo/Idh/MocA family oxidoreductase [Alistipes sp.]